MLNSQSHPISTNNFLFKGQDKIQSWALLHNGYVSLDKLFNPSEPQLSHLIVMGERNKTDLR